MQLVIGNKNYSSWSMRPWVLMRELGLPFDEIKLRLDLDAGSDFYRLLTQYSPAGRVPVLLDGDLAVWDTLAITETLHERFPDRCIWPAEPRQRARARSLAAEMHAGFGALRQHCPMNIEARLAEVGERVWAEHEAVRRDVARLDSMWTDALAASGGPFLFGAFCAADAFYAPVCMRFVTYALPLSAPARAYVDHVATAPSVAAWVADALAEQDFLDCDEPYRRGR